MIMKFIGILLMLCMGTAFAGEEQGALSAFVAYTDLRMGSIERSLEIAASTHEAKSGKWEDVKDLLQGYQKSEDGLILWYALSDGGYYTVDRGLMDVKLNDRSYFPDLLAGRNVVGSLVVSKSTGRRSAVIAVPVVKDGKVVGAVGASLFLDGLSSRIGSILSLEKGKTFFALAPDGLTALHSKAARHFLDPRELGGESLKKAANEMLSKDSGEVAYEYDNATKRAVFRTSPLTHWKFAISSDGGR
ncbi:MAG: cache domain-containing protein [Burkholderiales bacterium]|nr:cache domain-containing protein [Burkholderiales bacterium]